MKIDRLDSRPILVVGDLEDRQLTTTTARHLICLLHPAHLSGSLSQLTSLAKSSVRFLLRRFGIESSVIVISKAV